MTGYIANIFTGIWRLMQGMYITMLNFVRPKLTEQYPENRGRHEYFERFRALLTMPHDADNHHKCTACSICQNTCPNGTITVLSKMEDDPVTGKPKKVLDRHIYDVGGCIFCELCVRSCPFDAIVFTNSFEHSVFTKSTLVKQLNRPGSSLAPKPVAAPAPASASTPATESQQEVGADKAEGDNTAPAEPAAVPASNPQTL